MEKLQKFFISLLFVGTLVVSAWAVEGIFTKIENGGALNNDGAVTFNGNVTLGNEVTDTITFTGVLLLTQHATPDASLTPSAAGQLVWNTGSSELCVSTGTTVGSWVLASSGSTTCSD